MESVSLIDNVLFSMDTFLDHFSDTRRRESRIAFPPSVDWTRCNDELRNRVVGAIVVERLSFQEIILLLTFIGSCIYATVSLTLKVLEFLLKNKKSR